MLEKSPQVKTPAIAKISITPEVESFINSVYNDEEQVELEILHPDKNVHDLNENKVRKEWLLFMILVYLVDAEYPFVFYENICNSKLFVKAIGSMNKEQKQLIQHLLPQQQQTSIYFGCNK